MVWDCNRYHKFYASFRVAHVNNKVSYANKTSIRVGVDQKSFIPLIRLTTCAEHNKKERAWETNKNK